QSADPGVPGLEACPSTPSLMFGGCFDFHGGGGFFGFADAVDEALGFGAWRREEGGESEGHHEVEQHAEGSDRLRADADVAEAKRPGRHSSIHGHDDVAAGEQDSAEHAADGGHRSDAATEDSKDDDWEKTGCRQAEGEGDDLADEAGRIHSED